MKTNIIKVVAAFFSLIISLTANSQAKPFIPSASQVFVDDIAILPVDCFLVKPLSGQSGQTCYRENKIFQLQTTAAQYKLLDRFDINSPYDFISKNCKQLDNHNTIGLSFWCFNRDQNWSIQFYYYFQSHPAINLLEIRSIELKTCASSDADQSYRFVIQKFGRPDNIKRLSDDQRLEYQRHYLLDRLVVTHRMSYPDEVRYQSNSHGNGTVSCPGNYYLDFKLEPKQFHTGRANVIAKILADQSKGSLPKF
jgi:hypothetical protein